MALDKVKPLKIENSALGGTQNDMFPTEANPAQDYLAAKGIALEGNEVAVISGNTGVMKFQDSVETTQLSLTDLRTASKTTFNNSTNQFTATNVQTAIEELKNSFTVPSTDQMYFVDKLGSDTTGNGSIGRPFLTIAKSISTITDSSPTKRYGILVGPGDYNENLVLKANIFIRGDTPLTTKITGSTLTINDATWNVAGADNRSGFQDVSVNPACTFDFSSQANNTAGKLYFWNIRTSGAWTGTANTNINQIIIQDSQIFGSTTLVGCNTNFISCLLNSVNVSLSSGTSSGQGAGSLSLIGGSTSGNITGTWTSNGSVTINLNGVAIGSSTILTASGASCTVNANDGGLPVPANRSFTSSAILNRLNDNFAKGLLSATTNIDVSAATAPTAGQALVATSSTVALWSAVSLLVTSETTATADATTTSGTDALLTTMTITPASGTYLVMFTTSITSSAAGAAISCSLYVGGSQKTDSLRKISPFDGGTLSSLTARGAMAITGIVTVNGSQAIEIRWSTSGGTATCGARTLNTLKVA